MSRVERTENPGERRGFEESREAGRGRETGARHDEPSVSRTPGKAEGEEGDVERALGDGRD